MHENRSGRQTGTRWFFQGRHDPVVGERPGFQSGTHPC